MSALGKSKDSMVSGKFLSLMSSMLADSNFSFCILVKAPPLEESAAVLPEDVGFAAVAAFPPRAPFIEGAGGGAVKPLSLPLKSAAGGGGGGGGELKSPPKSS